MQPVLPVVTRHPARRGALGWFTEDTVSGMARRKAMLGYLFILPTILGILVFTVGPVIAALALSFFSWDVITPASYVGLTNYHVLTIDPEIPTAFRNTAAFVLLAVTLQVVVGLTLALQVRRRMPIWLRYYFRSAFFIPLLTAGATISIVMAYVFNDDFGIVNYYLGLIGLPRVPWLTNSNWAMITIVLTYVWQQLGFTFILFTGGLNNISREVMEAADVDGAGGWTRLWRITIPMISPTIFFVAVVGIIGALQVFDIPYVMTNGGPGDSTLTVVMVIYRAAFQNLQIGYGSAVAMLLFVVIMAVTGVQFWASRRWVFYQ
jgi:multiple sugar transport system permease protein